jgi:hypothetical protein
MPQGPWEKYQPQAQDGPWTKYQNAAPTEDLDAIRAAQAAKYPTRGPQGVDDAHPTVNNFMTNLWGSVDRNLAAPIRQAVSDPVGAVSGLAGAAAHGLTPSGIKDQLTAGPLRRLITPPIVQASKGDYSGAAGDVAGMALSAAIPGAANAAAKTVAPVMKGTAGLVKRGAGAVGDVAQDKWISARNTPEQAITKGIKPPRSNIGFFEKLDRSVPEIKAVEGQLGKPIENIDDLLEGAKLAKKNVRAQFDAIAGDKLSQIDGADIANKTGNQDYFRTFSIEELEGRLRNVNAQLDTYYDKFPAARRAATAGNAETAGLVSEAKAIRDTLYKALDPAGEGGAPAELQRRYGSIMDLEQEALKRRNVAARANPDSLTEQLGTVGAGMQIGKGLLRGLTGDFKGGLTDIAGAATGYGTSRAIKAANATDALIKNAFKRYKKTPTPVDFTRQPLPTIPDPYGVRRMTPNQLRGGK